MLHAPGDQFPRAPPFLRAPAESDPSPHAQALPSPRRRPTRPRARLLSRSLPTRPIARRPTRPPRAPPSHRAPADPPTVRRPPVPPLSAIRARPVPPFAGRCVSPRAGRLVLLCSTVIFLNDFMWRAQASEWRSRLVVWFGASASPSPGPAGCLPSHPPPSPFPFPLPHPLPHCYERCKLQALPPSAAAAIAGRGPGAGPDAGRWPIRRRARADPAPGSGRSGAGPTRTRTWHLRTLVCYHQDCNRNGCVPQRAAAGRDSARHIVDNIVNNIVIDQNNT
jgi:hypothetical protein